MYKVPQSHLCFFLCYHCHIFIQTMFNIKVYINTNYIFSFYTTTALKLSSDLLVGSNVNNPLYWIQTTGREWNTLVDANGQNIRVHRRKNKCRNVIRSQSTRSLVVKFSIGWKRSLRYYRTMDPELFYNLRIARNNLVFKLSTLDVMFIAYIGNGYLENHIETSMSPCIVT